MRTTTCSDFSQVSRARYRSPRMREAMMSASLSLRSLKRLLQDLTTLYGKHRTGISRTAYLSILTVLIYRIRNAVKEQKAAVAEAQEARRQGRAAGKQTGDGADPTTKRRKVELDREFFRNLGRLLRICIPGWRSYEARLLVQHSCFLIARTMISLYIARLDGRLVRDIVRGRAKSFLKSLVWWMLVAVPATFTNSMLTWHQTALALAYRSRLTNHIHNKYLGNMTFYTLSALDDRIKNADQLIVVDVSKFSNSLAQLYSSLTKPILDIAINSWSITRSVGTDSFLGVSIAVHLSSLLLRAVTPPFGKYVAEEAKLEGEFRFQHSRLIDYSEEIALYFGHEAEKDAVDRSYFTLIKHVNRILKRKLWHGIMEDYVIKYTWTALGYVLCAVPVFYKRADLGPSEQFGDVSENLMTTRRLLINCSEAFGKLMTSYKDISQLAGYTSRVSTLLDVIADTERGHFEKALVSSASIEENAAVLAGRGELEEGDDIKFEGVPIVSPNGDVLVKALSFHIRNGDHLLIVGPNGCGKSSLFRILGGLWPVYGGLVRKPPSEDIFYIPQRPYLSKGTLRQQILYPDTLLDMRARHVTDNDLADILRRLGLQHLLRAQHSKHADSTFEYVENAGHLKPSAALDTEAEWTSLLSMGDQQRIAAARLFYHKPKYAILDECTSSLTPEIERTIYTEAKRLDITLMTVSHRRSLWRYHGWILQFDGQGSYVFTKLDAEKRLALEDEREEIEMQLRAMPEIEKRIADLEAGGAGVVESEAAAS
ncbi:ATP-binding cassette long-chain fatty acid transporter pxa2 [Saxophila tyrrhenica]|uniref:ATP-binding cassette long-chain fatty acid transporter pxa2 n=1 Tax=Saxophila tyrrhenica TaxID=1690608 RepID=A0AAV9PPP0_9PEZI|nr:ATP-binding cassette long-chain fatty acid transporter pxa2 [Saxophila tyrrhenica]